MRLLWTGVVLAAGASLLLSQPEPRERVGPRPDGTVLLSTGWVLKPAGRQIELSTFPMASAVSPDGKFIVVLNGGYRKPSLISFHAESMQQIDTREVDDAWLGISFAPSGGVFYVSGGSTSSVFEFALSAEGKIEARRTFPIVPEGKRTHADFVGDVALSPDGRLIYAAALYRDSIWVINPQSGMVIKRVPSARRPSRILFPPDGKTYFVTGWADGTLYQHDTESGDVRNRISLGLQPTDLVWRPKQSGDQQNETTNFDARLYVTTSGTNQVVVVGVTEERSLKLAERINVTLQPYSPAGMTPSAVALSKNMDRLYVACSDANALAVVDLTGERATVMGFVPTAWYPTSVRALENGSVMVLNGRGPRSFPNPQGPNPTKKVALLHEGTMQVQYVGLLQNGSASIIPPLTPDSLYQYTQDVLKLSPYRDTKLEDAGDAGASVVPNKPDSFSPIQHVIYIVKENRTYDQVLGDVDSGNGDASLTLFGAKITPNQHKIVQEFALLDNFYVNADVSADGHNWSSAAIAPAYVQRMWPNSYAGRRKHYDYEGSELANTPPAGYIWTNVMAKGLTVRNYGWWVDNITPTPESGRQVKTVRDPALAPHTNLEYRGFDLDYKDVDRVKVFLKDLAGYENQGKLPSFITLRLGNDHTSGTAAKKISPQAAVADNDYALGQVVEALSHSRFWSKTAIFVVEDDAQNGPDHVDSHRSPVYVISPYTRGRGTISNFYNTVSVLRTMELILGLRPMTIHDAGARPMFAVFGTTPDAKPFDAVKPGVSLEERNPENGPTTARSNRMDLDEADLIEDDELNEILWRAIKHTEPPAPVRSFLGR